MTAEQPARPPLITLLLRALRIAASTVALVEALRNDWLSAGLAALAWLVFIQVERSRAAGTGEEPSDP
ncbi:hypothetical protein ACLM44_00765 [Synechococcus sp. W2B2]|uniref:hypothetical protein n=1 Tax=unclassified Synechococcus TaxID=2626047 RepID=UPI00006ADB3C|nr:hypothetical protein [Synechococcus sp. WH 7805]EAR17598.1 hypothetical protein WH7805_00750 [Synechococcus sp. WH 7805]